MYQKIKDKLLDQWRSNLRARKVWGLVIGNVDYDPGNTNFFIWLDAYLKSKDDQIDNVEWSIIFTSTIWHIWKM